MYDDALLRPNKFSEQAGLVRQELGHIHLLVQEHATVTVTYIFIHICVVLLQDHDEVVSSLKAKAGQPAQAQPADSLPSTQACSGDTYDDR